MLQLIAFRYEEGLLVRCFDAFGEARGFELYLVELTDVAAKDVVVPFVVLEDAEEASYGVSTS